MRLKRIFAIKEIGGSSILFDSLVEILCMKQNLLNRILDLDRRILALKGNEKKEKENKNEVNRMTP